MTDWLQRAAADRPDALALADRERRLSYAELLAEAGALASGMGAGDLVRIAGPPGVDVAVSLHAAMLAGATAQLVPATLPPNVPNGASYRPETDVRRGEGAPSVLARVMTSGTSGDPRPIDLTAGNFEASARASAARLGADPGDRWLCCLPLHHVGGLSVLIRSAIQATAAVIEPGFDAGRVATLIEAGEVTIASLVPTQLVRLLDAGAPVELPRMLLVGGGPLPPDVLEEALARGATVVQTYGLTEACSQVCTLGPDEARERAGSAGRPLDGTEVRVDAGEILVRGPTVSPGAIAGDGWLHTGDMGRLDDEGYLWVEGRRDDLIVSGGENVRPERVEAVLREHPAIAEAAVVGREDREWGQAVVAFVVVEGSATIDPKDLLDHARARLERHEVPKRVEVIDELPRTASGKLLRRKLWVDM